MKVLHILNQVNRGGTETLSLVTCRNDRAIDLVLIIFTFGKVFRTRNYYINQL